MEILSQCVFLLTTIMAIGAMVYRIVVKKDIFSIFTYILAGVYFPLLLSLLDWSQYHIENKGIEFRILISEFSICLFFFSMLPQKRFNMVNLQFQKKKKCCPVEVYNIVYVIAILVENFYVSGYFVPSIHGIDVHTARMPFIYFVTTGIYLVAMIDTIEYLISRKWRYLVYAVACLSVNVITKSSRIDAVICAIQVMSFYLFYKLGQRKIYVKKDKMVVRKESRMKFFIVSIAVLSFIVSIGISVGSNRLATIYNYTVPYSKQIEYHGPEFMKEVLAYLYGYFGISFDNLSYNINRAVISHNYIGLNTFRGLYFGLLQFDNVLGLDGNTAGMANQVRVAAAAIPTGFWDAYFDFGLFAILAYFIFFTIWYAIRRGMTKGSMSTKNVMMYFYWIPIWLFYSFDNRVFDYQVLWHFIIIAFISRRYLVSYRKL